MTKPGTFSLKTSQPAARQYAAVFICNSEGNNDTQCYIKYELVAIFITLTLALASCLQNYKNRIIAVQLQPTTTEQPSYNCNAERMLTFRKLDFLAKIVTHSFYTNESNSFFFSFISPACSAKQLNI